MMFLRLSSHVLNKNKSVVDHPNYLQVTSNNSYIQIGGQAINTSFHFCTFTLSQCDYYDNRMRLPNFHYT